MPPATQHVYLMSFSTESVVKGSLAVTQDTIRTCSLICGKDLKHA